MLPVPIKEKPMGMFDFIKDAGGKIFKPGEAKAEPEEKARSPDLGS